VDLRASLPADDGRLQRGGCAEEGRMMARCLAIMQP
jgi:hypothetical protein